LYNDNTFKDVVLAISRAKYLTKNQ